MNRGDGQLVPHGDGAVPTAWPQVADGVPDLARAGVAAAVDALPLPAEQPGDRDSVRRATRQWLDPHRPRMSPRTQRAYFRELAEWSLWCARHRVDLLAARPADVQDYLAARGGAPSTYNRRVAAISSWYGYLLRQQVPGVAGNPAAAMDRHPVGRDASPTVGVTAEQAQTLITTILASGRRTALRDAALIALLYDLGLRAEEALGLNVDDLGEEQGHRVVRFVAKGGRLRRRSVPPQTYALISRYLQDRVGRGLPGDGPLFATEPVGGGVGRMDRPALARMLRQAAKSAGIPAWAKLSPHSLRHAFATVARANRVPLEDVQDAMGHADPRTTRRYDRDRYNLDRDPSYVVVQARSHPAAPASDLAGR